MFGFLKKMFGGNSNKLSNPDAGELPKPQGDLAQRKFEYIWYNADDEGNPFGKRFLDCREFAVGMLSTTTKPEIAESFNAGRNDDGKRFIDAKIEDSATLEVDLRYACAKPFAEGPTFKSTTMEEKWDIYYYNDHFLLTRSWTGGLMYRAATTYKDGEYRITKIECLSGDLAGGMATNIVHFLMLSHVFNRTVPHKVPKDWTNNYLIAVQSFNLYGKRTYFATYDDITDLSVQDYPLGGNLLKSDA